MSEENKDDQKPAEGEAVAPEEAAAEEAAPAEETKPTGLKIDTLFAVKEGMGTYYTKKGNMFAVTVLRFEPLVVSQVKTAEKDGYEAVQLASTPKKAKRSSKAEVSRLKAAGFESGARVVREVRGAAADATPGLKVDIGSLEEGTKIKVSGVTKGKGFAGVMRRYNFGGGRATHGSGFHRAPGSIGNCIWPGRVMAGRKMPGRMGGKQKTVTSKIVEVLPDENVIIVKGAIPGSRNTLVQLTRA